jgi:hypothetical protein
MCMMSREQYQPFHSFVPQFPIADYEEHMTLLPLLFGSQLLTVVHHDVRRLYLYPGQAYSHVVFFVLLCLEI